MSCEKQVWPVFAVCLNPVPAVVCSPRLLCLRIRCRLHANVAYARSDACAHVATLVVHGARRGPLSRTYEELASVLSLSITYGRVRRSAWYTGGCRLAVALR